MRGIRRATAILTLSLVLQPSVLGIGEGCQMPSTRGAADARDAHVMSAMIDEESMEMAVADAAPADRSDGPTRGCDTDDASRTCDGPEMPSGCALTAACLSPALAPFALTPLSVGTIWRVRSADPLALLAGIVAAPESPPPRA